MSLHSNSAVAFLIMQIAEDVTKSAQVLAVPPTDFLDDISSSIKDSRTTNTYDDVRSTLLKPAEASRDQHRDQLFSDPATLSHTQFQLRHMQRLLQTTYGP